MSTSKFSIPRTEFMNRLKFTRAELRELGFDALLAVSGYAERDGNVCYLCGHKNAFPYSNAGNIISGLGFSALLVPTESQNPTILVAPLGYQSDVVTGVDQAKTGTNLADELVAAIKESGLESAKIALAGSDIIPVAYLDKVKSTCPSLKIDYQDGLVSNQRMIKSENELRLIRFASKIADKALGLTIDSVKPGMTESEIGTIARRTAMELGADYVVRDRVQSGPEIGRLRWPFASKRKVKKGELVSIDFVGWVNSYGFDILRFACAGRPNKEQKRVVEGAAQATASMSDALRDGTTVESCMISLKEIERQGFHVSPFGHAIGLEIVESPYLLPGGSGDVKKNMVFCVEPDVKLGKYSASIENEIVVTDGKPEILTKLSEDI